MSVSAVSMETLEELRQRVLPMLRLVAAEYEQRVPQGYPIVVDSVGSGLVGIEIDPNFALYFTVEGNRPFADFYWRSSRIDARTCNARRGTEYHHFRSSVSMMRRPTAIMASRGTG